MKNLFNLKHTKPSLKRRVGLVSLLSLLFVLGIAVFGNSSLVEAACQPPTTSYGTDTLNVQVTAPSTQNYVIWTRLKAPTTANNQIMLAVDGGTCYNVGGSSSMPASTWTWVNYQNGATGTPITASLAPGNHTLEFFGLDPGVAVDRVLLLSDTSCVPVSTGDNCAQNQPVSVPFYMQAGGSGYTDAQGNQWQADQYYTQTDTYGETAGVSNGGDGSVCTTTLPDTNCTTHAISGTNNQEVYQTERWGDFEYNIPLTNGSYDLELLFAEIHLPANGRVFNVSVNGTQVLTNFNIVNQIGSNGQAIGAYAAYNQTFPVTVTNGILNIVFTGVTDTAKLSGLEILPATTAPTISLTAPASGATVGGTSVPLTSTASASGSIGVANVKYYVNGNFVGLGTKSGSSYTYDWNASSATSGSNTLMAVVTDNDGVQTSTSETIQVANNCTNTPNPPTALSSPSNTATSVNLQWTASSNQPLPDCSGIAGYYIIRNGTTVGQVAAGTSNTLTYTDNNNVAAGVTYNYQVEAFDDANPPNVSSPSNTLQVKTTGVVIVPPTAPTSLKATAESSSQINLNWGASTDSSGVVGYAIFEQGNSTPITTIKPQYLSASITGLTPSTNYTFYVEAYAGASPYTYSAQSNSIVISTLAAGSVTALEGTVSNKSGNALSGAAVTAGSATGKNTTTTNSKGVYFLPVEAGDRAYYYSDKGYTTDSITVSIAKGIEKTRDVTLTPN